MHVYASPLLSSATGKSFRESELQILHEEADSGGGADATLREAAAAFLKAWDPVSPHVKPRLAGCPCTLETLGRLVEEYKKADQEMRAARSKTGSRLAPSCGPGERDLAALPDEAVFIPAEVYEYHGELRINVHWQPFVRSTGQLLCTNHACLHPLDMTRREALIQQQRSAHLPPPGEESGPADDGARGGGGRGGRGRGGGASDGAPRVVVPARADTSCFVRYEQGGMLDLFCGGKCHGAYRYARDPTTVRRELRNLHTKQSGSLYCQLCGVDLLALVAHLSALPSEEERRRLLLEKVPALANPNWGGLLRRAVRTPTEGNLWEADHELEVRQGGGEAGSLADYAPLCVACHRGKTNQTDHELRQARAAGGFEAAPAEPSVDEQRTATARPAAKASPPAQAPPSAAAPAEAAPSGKKRRMRFSDIHRPPPPRADSPSPPPVAPPVAVTSPDSSSESTSPIIPRPEIARRLEKASPAVSIDSPPLQQPPPMPIGSPPVQHPPAIPIDPPPVQQPLPPSPAVWEVELQGRYSAYKDEMVQRTLEAAFQRGDDTVRVEVMGKAYDVFPLQGGRKRQRLESDQTKTRSVRRVEHGNFY